MHAIRVFAIALLVALSAWSATALFAQSSSPRSATGDTGISIGAPKGGTRLGAMKSLADDIRSRLRSAMDTRGLIAIIAAAMVYGIFHAMGPGHQKTLITGYLLAEGGNAWRVLAAAGIAAASHAFSVVALFGALAFINGGLSATSDEGARIMTTRLSALALAILALRMLWTRIQRARDRFAGDHGPNCSCPAHRDHGTVKKASPLIIFAGSLVPCPGAAFFLLLGFSAGYPLAGILAVLAISVGMWITLVAVGAIAFGVRSSSLFYARRGHDRIKDIISSILEIGGSALVLFFAIALLF